MVTANVNLGKIPALIAQAPKIARKEMMIFLQTSVRTLVSSSGNVPGLVQITPPAGGAGGKVRGSEAKKAGEAATAGDIASVYISEDKLYPLIRSYGGIELAKQYWYLLLNKPERLRMWLDLSAPDAVRAMPKGWDGGAAHQARRDKYGRVRGNKPSVILRAGEQKELQKYIKAKQKNVGMLAAGIVSAYNGRFGPLRGVHAFISRHSASWVSGRMLEKGGDERSYHVTLRIDAGVQNREMQRRFTYVLNYRIKAMNRQVPYIARSIEAKIAAQIARH